MGAASLVGCMKRPGSDGGSGLPRLDGVGKFFLGRHHSPGRPAAVRPDDSKNLNYATAPLKKDTEITGHPIVKLEMSSSAADGSVFAYLSSVAPDRKVSVLTDGRLRLAIRGQQKAKYDVLSTPYHRGNAKNAKPMKGTQSVRFDLLPLSTVVPRGADPGRASPAPTGGRATVPN